MSVLVVHHTGLKEQERPRGSNALLGASDFMIFAKNNADLVSLKSVRMKDGDPPKPLTLQFNRVLIDEDEEGLGIYSSHLTRADGVKPDQSGLRDSQKSALKYLKELDQQSRDIGLNGAIMLDDFKESWRLGGENIKNANRILESLEKRKAILINDGVIRLRQ